MSELFPWIFDTMKVDSLSSLSELFSWTFNMLNVHSFSHGSCRRCLWKEITAMNNYEDTTFRAAEYTVEMAIVEVIFL